MKERVGGARGRVALLVTGVVLVGVVFASVAIANNLDKRTMTTVAKKVAKKDCQDTSGCDDWQVRGLHRVSRHKAIGKIAVTSTKEGATFECRRQIVIKLDHLTGELAYGVSKRRCQQIG
jgi:hypothetical protein